jgi:hypothetical protein
MADQKETKQWKKKVYINKGGSGALYGLGVLGAAVYYIQQATSFWIGVLGVIKAFFWPALVVYKVFEMLHL